MEGGTQRQYMDDTKGREEGGVALMYMDGFDIRCMTDGFICYGSPL